MTNNSNTASNSSRILLSGLVYDQGKSGIAEYTRQMVKALCNERKVSIALLKKDIPHFPVDSENLEIVRVSNLFSHPVMNILWHMFILPLLAFKRRYDWIILPAINRRMGLWYPKPSIGIAHDLSQFSVEGKYDLFRTLYVKCLLPFCTGNISHIIAISHNTKQDLIRYWNIPAHKMSVQYNGYDDERYTANTESTESTESKILDHYQLTQPYLIYVSRIEHPGKNHVRLIEAFDALDDALTQKHSLVFAGGDWNGAEQVKAAAAQARKAKQIKFLGYVPVEHLPTLYRQAEFMVFPSLYEGFGIPLIEAMACGTPTLCSNNSALGEIAGDAAFTFDPTSSASIAQTFAMAMSDAHQVSQKVAAAKEHCKQFSWDKLASHLNRQMNQQALRTTLKGFIKYVTYTA